MENLVKKYAEVLSNISNLSVEKSEHCLASISDMHNINTEKEFVKLLDTVIEISNKRAITVEQLILSLAMLDSKEVSVEQLLEYIVRIGESTRDSGYVIGNTLKDVFSRMVDENLTMTSETYEILKEAGLDTDKTSGDVIKELSLKWDELSKEQQTEIGLALAGRYNLSRFIAIMKEAN